VPPAPATRATVAAGGEDRAAGVVRSYLGALSRGDRATAGNYLARGNPTETFMDADSHVESIRTEGIPGGRYRVSADIHNARGEFYETFDLETGPGGLQITGQYWIKAQ
jgi:hypothetical protein